MSKESTILIRSIEVMGKYKRKFSFSILISPGKLPNHENIFISKCSDTNKRRPTNKNINPMLMNTLLISFFIVYQNSRLVVNKK